MKCDVGLDPGFLLPIALLIATFEATSCQLYTLTTLELPHAVCDILAMGITHSLVLSRSPILMMCECAEAVQFGGIWMFWVRHLWLWKFNTGSNGVDSEDRNTIAC